MARTGTSSTAAPDDAPPRAAEEQAPDLDTSAASERPRPEQVDSAPGVPPSLVLAASFCWRALVVLAAAALVIYVLMFIRLVSLPVILGLFAATMLAPPTRWLSRVMPRGIASALVVLFGLLVVAGLLAAVVPPIVSELGSLGDTVIQGANRAGQYFGVPRPEAVIDQAVNESVAFVQGELVSGALFTAEILAGLLLMLAITFLFLNDGERIWAWVVWLFPLDRRADADRAGRITWDTLGDYIRGTALVALVDTVLVATAILIIGIPLVVPLAVLVFLAAFFPLIGIVVAGTVATLVALVTAGPVPALVLGGIILVVHLLEGNFLYPVIAGRSLHLHPLAVLLAITTGSILGGPVGAFLSIPVVAAGHAVLAELAPQR